jgi:8-oxo-dGTP pyrophosphatase MutT (NUDIX family)
LLLEQLRNNEDLSDRKNYTGHIAGSDIVFSPDLKKVLLIYHPTFERWQQAGGHWDKPEVGPWETAVRELAEETGVKIAHKLHVSDDHRVPLSIKSEIVPNRPPKNEPEHYHHDFRYLYIAESEGLELKDKVIKQAKWFSLDAPEVDHIRTEVNRALPLLKNSVIN